MSRFPRTANYFLGTHYIMGVGHRQFFLTLHSAQPQDKAKVIKRLQNTNHMVWTIVALEPYTGRENDDGSEHTARTANHLHVMFRVKNQVSGKKLRAQWVKWWKAVSPGATDQDVYERPGEGSFASNVNYVTKVPMDEHKSSEQLDPEPYIWPTDYQEAPGRVKVSTEEVVEFIQTGATYEDLLRKWPCWMLNNGHKVSAFMKRYAPIVKEIKAAKLKADAALLSPVIELVHNHSLPPLFKKGCPVCDRIGSTLFGPLGF